MQDIGRKPGDQDMGFVRSLDSLRRCAYSE